jgi:hypothetical protein
MISLNSKVVAPTVIFLSRLKKGVVMLSPFAPPLRTVLSTAKELSRNFTQPFYSACRRLEVSGTMDPPTGRLLLRVDFAKEWPATGAFIRLRLSNPEQRRREPERAG